MSNAKENKSNAADDMESKMEERDQVRRDEERKEWGNLNQNLQTGTHESPKFGVPWPPSYKTRRKGSRQIQGPENK